MENSIILKTVLIEKAPFWVTILEYDKKRYDELKGYDDKKWWYHSYHEEIIGQKVLVRNVNDFEDICIGSEAYLHEDVYIVEEGLYSRYLVFKKDCKRMNA